MKKKIIIANLMLMGLLAHAQEIADNLSKRIFLGGNIGYEATKDTKYSVSVQPTIGYFFTDDIVGGAKIGYTYDYRKADKSDNHAFSTTPFIRKYWRTGHRFMPSLELNAGFNWALKDNDHVRHEKRNGRYTWGVALEPGFSYRLSNKAFLHTTVGRFGYANEGANNDAYKFGIKLDNVSLGVNFFL